MLGNAIGISIIYLQQNIAEVNMTGGHATNAGIEYQQRVGAWCLVNQFLEEDISMYFDVLDDKTTILKTCFETDVPIDDIKLECTNNKTIFLQIKRTIDFSTQEGSEFVKTLLQFVKEFVNSPEKDSVFGLITSSDASNKITNILKKLAIAVRLNREAFCDNPINKIEKDVLEKTEQIFQQAYESLAVAPSSRVIFLKFLSRVFISVIDIESGSHVEQAVLMTLRSLKCCSPEMVWGLLIKNCLYYATNRFSIENEKLKSILNRHLEIAPLVRFDNTDNKVDFPIQDCPVAKELIFVESFSEGFDFILMELYRFSECCENKTKFWKNHAKLANGIECVVIQRFATFLRAEQYLDENKDIYSDKRIAIIPANDIAKEEDSECAALHRSLIEKLIKENESFHNCLHCGKEIGFDQDYLIEVDDLETPPAFGIVHRKCVRPIDRIVGHAVAKDDMANSGNIKYEYQKWAKLLLNGQGLMNAIKSSMLQPVVTIWWNPEIEYDPDYSYCIRYTLENGDSFYDYRRGKIERLSKAECESRLAFYGEKFQEYKKINDPMCYLPKTKSVANYSIAVTQAQPNEAVLEIKSFEIERYSKLLAKAFENNISYYTPLCLVQNSEQESILCLDGIIPLISDPTQIEPILNNWKNVGKEIEEQIELKIIKNDQEFDNYMHLFFSDGCTPIIDPFFDKNFQLVKGYPIVPIDCVIEMQNRQRQGGVQ